MKGFAWIMGDPTRYRAGLWMAAMATGAIRSQGGWIRNLPAVFSEWTRSREFPRFSRKPLRERLHKEWNQLRGGKANKSPGSENPLASPTEAPSNEIEPARRLQIEMEALGVNFIKCRTDTLTGEVEARLKALQARSLLVGSHADAIYQRLLQDLRSAGFQLLEPVLRADGAAERREALEQYDKTPVGLTGAVAAIAETGTLVLAAAEECPQMTSLLPRRHFAILRRSQIHRSLQEWLPSSGPTVLASAQSVSLITGPSRSADIEMQSIVGVHGPSEVVVFCVDD